MITRVNNYVTFHNIIRRRYKCQFFYFGRRTAGTNGDTTQALTAEQQRGTNDDEEGRPMITKFRPASAALVNRPTQLI